MEVLDKHGCNRLSKGLSNRPNLRSREKHIFLFRCQKLVQEFILPQFNGLSCTTGRSVKAQMDTNGVFYLQGKDLLQMWVWTQLFLHLQTSRWHPPSQEHGRHLSTLPLWKTTNILALLSNWCNHQLEIFPPKTNMKTEFDVGYNFQLEFSVVASLTIKPEHPTDVAISCDGNIAKKWHGCQSLVPKSQRLFSSSFHSKLPNGMHPNTSIL